MSKLFCPWLAVAIAALPAAAAADTDSDSASQPDQQVADTAPAAEAAPSYGVGSYGRVGVGTDLRGSTPEAVNVVAHGSRVVQRPYLELDLYYRARAVRNLEVKTVATVAFDGDLFHYNGEFDATIALRNLYAEAELTDTWSMWVGSRMYRGDDIYLLDYWPLDELNTIGGGVEFRTDRLEAGVHAGANRLTDQFQYQEFDVPAPEFGSETITQLDRQRMIASGKVSYRFAPKAKLKLYGELAGLPRGEVRRRDNVYVTLPTDYGWTLGAQLGLWGFADRNSHLNLFARFSQGLTAHDELAIPAGFDPGRHTFPGASETVLGWSGNYERGRFGAMTGGYLRRFVDADGNSDRDDRWEWIAAVRPYAAVSDAVVGTVEVSYQRAYPRGVSPTLLLVTEPAVLQIAPMLVYAPFGIGSYDRPQFRLVYRAANLNDDALDLYSPEDLRRNARWVHFLGMQVEWWFNSTYR